MSHRYSLKTLETSWISKIVQGKLAATTLQFLDHNQETSSQSGCRGALATWQENISLTETGIRAVSAVASREGLFPMDFPIPKHKLIQINPKLPNLLSM